MCGLRHATVCFDGAKIRIFFLQYDDFFFFLEGEGGVAEIGDTKVVVLLLTVFLFPSIDNAILLFLTAEHIYASVVNIRLSGCWYAVSCQHGIIFRRQRYEHCFTPALYFCIEIARWLHFYTKV